MKILFHFFRLINFRNLLLMILATFLVVACSSGNDSSERQKKQKNVHTEGSEVHDSKEHDEHSAKSSTIRGEHSREDGGEGKGEEDGTELGLGDIHDVTRHGVRLILKYDQATNFFVGSMENTTAEMIEDVRIEVHLSNGTELGPTTPVALKPKMKRPLKLQATEKAFEGWSTHAEIRNEEHQHEDGKEHDQRGPDHG